MNEQSEGRSAVAALTRVGDMLREAAAHEDAHFTLTPEAQADLNQTLTTFVDFVRVNPPDADNAAAQAQVSAQLVDLWGVLLSQARPIRAVVGDAELDAVLRDYSWVEGLAQEGGPQATTHCGRCGRLIPGGEFAVCAACQLDGYHVCDYCHQRVASGTTPYCDQCAEEIVGAG
jgi:hypothetical protein